MWYAVYLDIELCDGAFDRGSTLGRPSLICESGEKLGRLTLGLYGDVLPATVADFVAMLDGTEGVPQLVGTVFQKSTGTYLLGGRQGAARVGDVAATGAGKHGWPGGAARAQELLSASSYRLAHTPGALSLALTENDDRLFITDRDGYHGTEFMLVTGPAPAVDLDGSNVVFGRVLEGYGTLASMAAVRAFRPNARLRSLNAMGETLGDKRAETARQQWDRPLRAIVIRDAGVLSAPAPAMAVEGDAEAVAVGAAGAAAV